MVGLKMRGIKKQSQKINLVLSSLMSDENMVNEWVRDLVMEYIN